MGRTYKTGPRRSRRRPDPSTIIGPGTQVYPLVFNSIGGGGSLVFYVFDIIDPATGQAVTDAVFSPTTLMSNAVSKTDAGTMVKPTSVTMPNNGQVQFNFNLIDAPSPGVLVLPGADPAIAGRNGERLGAMSHRLT